VGLLAITVTVSAFYWVLTFNPRQVTTTVTVTASPLDGGGLGRVLDVCFSWSRRCDEMVARLIDSARSRVLVAAYLFKNRWIAEALIRAHKRGDRGQGGSGRVTGPRRWGPVLEPLALRDLRQNPLGRPSHALQFRRDRR